MYNEGSKFSQSLEVEQPLRVPVRLWAEELEREAEEQIKNLARTPGVVHIAVMPDAHHGKGSTVGTVIATEKIVFPAAVGVDIGCGMAAVPTDLRAEDIDADDLRQLRNSIERGVPTAMNTRREPHAIAEAWAEQNTEAAKATTNGELKRKHLLALGTLGGGNHFIEVCLDTTGKVWIMLHSGSRNLGKELAEKHIEKAQAIAEQYYIPLLHRDLA